MHYSPVEYTPYIPYAHEPAISSNGATNKYMSFEAVRCDCSVCLKNARLLTSAVEKYAATRMLSTLSDAIPEKISERGCLCGGVYNLFAPTMKISLDSELALCDTGGTYRLDSSTIRKCIDIALSPAPSIFPEWNRWMFVSKEYGRVGSEFWLFILKIMEHVDAYEHDDSALVVSAFSDDVVDELFRDKKEIALIRCAFFGGSRRIKWIVDRRDILSKRDIANSTISIIAKAPVKNTRSIFDTYMSIIVETLPSLSGCSDAALDAMSALPLSTTLYSTIDNKIGSGNRPLFESSIRFAIDIKADSSIREWKCLFHMVGDSSLSKNSFLYTCPDKILDSLELNLVDICIWCHSASKLPNVPSDDISYPLATAVTILSEVTFISGRDQPGFPKMSEQVRNFIRNYRYPTKISMVKSIIYRNRFPEKPIIAPML